MTGPPMITTLRDLLIILLIWYILGLSNAKFLVMVGLAIVITQWPVISAYIRKRIK